MNGLVVQDSSRSGKVGWALTAHGLGTRGFIMSTFDTPPTGRRWRPSATAVIAELSDGGVEVVLDPMTHAALLPGANRFDIYDTWNLWAGARGELGSAAARREHIERVFAAQSRLDLPLFAPTVAIHSSLGADAQTALDLAAESIDLDRNTIVAVAAYGSFWAQGRLLDDFVGQVAQLRPSAVHVTSVRTAITYPVTSISRAEIEGLCRSIHSLSLRSEVVVQMGDLFALPGVAAGATAVGSGWDLRQRVFGPETFRINTDVRRSSKRITHRGLLGVLKRPEAERLRRSNRFLSERVVPGPLPIDGNALWEHHLSSTGGEIRELLDIPDRRDRVAELSRRYVSAATAFRTAEVAARPVEAGVQEWIVELQNGLLDYAASEGW